MADELLKDFKNL